MRSVNIVERARRRRRIRAAALRCFVERGIHATGIDEICAAAQTNPGPLYRDFRNRDAVVEAAAEEFAYRRAAQMRLLFRRETELAPGRAFMQWAAHQLLQTAAARKAEAALDYDFAAYALRNPAVAAALARHERVDRFAAALRGRPSGLDPRLTAIALFGAFDALHRVTLLDPCCDRAAAVEHLRVLTQRMLGHEGASGSQSRKSASVASSSS